MTGDDAADAEAAARTHAAAVPLPPTPPAPFTQPPPATPTPARPPPPDDNAPAALPAGVLADKPARAPAAAAHPLPEFVHDGNEALAARDLPFGALFPTDNTAALTAGVAALSLTPVGNIQAVERHYAHDDRKYRGADSESLYRHVAAFRALCTRMGVHPADRAACVPASLGPSRHNLPSICHDNATKSEDELWTPIQKRVYTPSRMTRLRTLWQDASLASFSRSAGDNDFQHFVRLVEYLKQLQEQLGPQHQHKLSLRDRVLDAVSEEPFWPELVARNLFTADALTDVIELLLQARTRAPPTPTTILTPAPAAPMTPTSAFSSSATQPLPPHLLTDRSTGDTCTISVEPYPADPTNVYWTLRQFRRGSTDPYASRRWTPHWPRGPSPAARCNACGAVDHWAASCPRRPPSSPPTHRTSPNDSAFPLRNRRSTRAGPVHFADTQQLPTPKTTAAPTIDAQSSDEDDTTVYDQSYLSMHFIRALEAAYTGSPLPSTAVVDTGSPPDVVSEGWINQNRPTFSSPLEATPSRIRFGKDTPLMLGTVGITLNAKDENSRTHTLQLPNGLVVASDHIPLIIGLKTSTHKGLIIDAAARTITVKGTATVFQCEADTDHLCLPRPSHAVSAYYTAPELAKSHRQFGHTGSDKVVAAFPPNTFTSKDVALLNRIGRRCDACQLHAQLPRGPKYSLPH